MTSKLSVRGHIPAILKLGLPLVGGHLAQMAIGMTDTIMIGWYGVSELAALTIAVGAFYALFLFAAGFAHGIMPLVATHATRNEEVMIRRVTRMALWLSVLCFVLIMPLFWFSGTVLDALGQEPEISALAQEYLRIAGWGLLPALILMVYKNYLAALEHTRVVLWITVLAAPINALANFMLIFGHWGAPELGIAGAGIASVVSQCVSLVVVIIYAQKVLPHHEILARLWRPDWVVMLRVFRLGLPVGVTTLAEVALFTAASILIGKIGAIPLAAHGIVMQLASTTFMIQLGLSNAATVRAGQALGRHNSVELRSGSIAILLVSLAGVAVSVALFVCLPDTLLSFFLDPEDPQREAVLTIGRQLLLMAAIFQLFDAAQALHVGLLRGLHDTSVPMCMAAFSYWGIGVPMAWHLGLTMGFGYMGVWLGLTIGLFAASILLGWRFWTWGMRAVERDIPRQSLAA